MNQRSRACNFWSLSLGWPTVHTTGALSDVTPPDFDAGIRWQADRRKAMQQEQSGAFWCLFAWDARLFAPAPSQLLPAVRAVECAVSNAADPRSKLPVRSSAWSAVPVAGLLSRATPRHMHCASGRRRLLHTPLGAHHSTMARWRASWLGGSRCSPT